MHIMNRTEIENILEKEFNNAILHEVGHAVVLEEFGGEGRIRIYEQISESDRQNGLKYISAQIDMFNLPQNAEQRQMIGVAGWLIERLHEIEFDDIMYQYLHDDFLEAVDDGAISETDLVHCNSISEDTLDKTLEILLSRQDKIAVLIEKAKKENQFILDAALEALVQ